MDELARKKFLELLDEATQFTTKNAAGLHAFEQIERKLGDGSLPESVRDREFRKITLAIPVDFETLLVAIPEFLRIVADGAIPTQFKGMVALCLPLMQELLVSIGEAGGWEKIGERLGPKPADAEDFEFPKEFDFEVEISDVKKIDPPGTDSTSGDGVASVEGERKDS